MNKKWPVLAALLLAGCATSSTVMDGGDGTYSVTGSAQGGFGGGAKASDLAFKEAQKFCSDKGGQRPLVVNSQPYSAGGYGAADNVTIRFRCAA